MPTPKEVDAAAKVLEMEFDKHCDEELRSIAEDREHKLILDTAGIAQAMLAAAEEARRPEADAEKVASIAAERSRIAEDLLLRANAIVRNPTSDGVDGYCAALVIGIADELRKPQ